MPCIPLHAQHASLWHGLPAFCPLLRPPVQQANAPGPPLEPLRVQPSNSAWTQCTVSLASCSKYQSSWALQPLEIEQCHLHHSAASDTLTSPLLKKSICCIASMAASSSSRQPAEETMGFSAGTTAANTIGRVSRLSTRFYLSQACCG